MSSKHWLAAGLLGAMYVLHNDWWFWADSRLVAGLPIGLAYHLAYMVVTAAVLVVVVELAWPQHLDTENDG
jgi:hypothetical protein